MNPFAALHRWLQTRRLRKAIRQILNEKPELTFEEIMEELKARGVD
jgi:hypothetical protein